AGGGAIACPSRTIGEAVAAVTSAGEGAMATARPMRSRPAQANPHKAERGSKHSAVASRALRQTRERWTARSLDRKSVHEQSRAAEIPFANRRTPGQGPTRG